MNHTPGLTIGLGRRVLELRCDDPGWESLAATRFGPFLVDAEPEVVLHYSVRVSRGPSEIPAHHLADARRRGLRVECGSDGWVVGSEGMRGRIARGGRFATLAGIRHTFPADLVLPQLWYALEPEGVLLHAALIAFGDRGIAAVGRSGQGKTTLATLAGGHALADEMVAVTPDGDGFRAASLPFWRGRAGSARLSEVVLLEHGGETVRRPLNRLAGCAQLARQVIWPADSARAAAALGSLERISAMVPLARFPFRPQPQAVEVLAA